MSEENNVPEPVSAPGPEAAPDPNVPPDPDTAPDPDAPPETLLADDGLLTVSPDELDLPAPTLEEPVISAEVASEASLDQVAAETEAVLQEVEQAGMLAGGRQTKSTADQDAVEQKIRAAASKARAEVTDEQEL